MLPKVLIFVAASVVIYQVRRRERLRGVKPVDNVRRHRRKRGRETRTKKAGGENTEKVASGGADEDVDYCTDEDEKKSDCSEVVSD